MDNNYFIKYYQNSKDEHIEHQKKKTKNKKSVRTIYIPENHNFVLEIYI
jgi:hypothetical protein